MHDPKDPFGELDDERTIIRPNPGRRTLTQSAKVESSFSPGPTIDTTDLAGLNPLEKSASLLLNLLGQIRNTSSHPDPTALHQQLAGEIRQFESRAQKDNIAPETIFTARYVLCTTVDEFVLSTPWGSTSVWRDQSLLRLFHQDTSGGDKFFLLLEKLIDDPTRNIDLLELMYVSLALGFQGRYRVASEGTSTLEAIRENLYRTVRNFRGDNEPALSLHWQGVDKSLVSKKARMPTWAIISIVLAVLGFVFTAFTFNLIRDSELLSAAMIDIGKEENLVPDRLLSTVQVVRHIEDPPPERFSLTTFLEQQILNGQVVVDEQAEKTTILIKGEGLFESAVDVIEPAFLPVIGRIGEGLEQTNGRIQISGHTDNIPISNRRFPSNRSLSQARADEVVRVLANYMSDADRMSSVGMADTKPIASNDTEEGRKQNRRVEIEVLERMRSN